MTIGGSDGSSYTLTATGGSQVVNPTSTTTYTATATGTGGKTTATATVTVAGAPTVTITANPTTVASGGPSTLTVTATNATTVTISGSDGSSYTAHRNRRITSRQPNLDHHLHRYGNWNGRKEYGGRDRNRGRRADGHHYR